MARNLVSQDYDDRKAAVEVLFLKTYLALKLTLLFLVASKFLATHDLECLESCTRIYRISRPSGWLVYRRWCNLLECFALQVGGEQ